MQISAVKFSAEAYDPVSWVATVSQPEKNRLYKEKVLAPSRPKSCDLEADKPPGIDQSGKISKPKLRNAG